MADLKNATIEDFQEAASKTKRSKKGRRGGRRGLAFDLETLEQIVLTPDYDQDVIKFAGRMAEKYGVGQWSMLALLGAWRHGPRSPKTYRPAWNRYKNQFYRIAAATGQTGPRWDLGDVPDRYFGKAEPESIPEPEVETTATPGAMDEEQEQVVIAVGVLADLQARADALKERADELTQGIERLADERQDLLRDRQQLNDVITLLRQYQVG